MADLSHQRAPSLDVPRNVKTPAGLQLLEQLDGSKHKTTIQHGIGGNFALPGDWDQAHVQADGSRGKGSATTVIADPSATEWDGETCQQGTQPWMADRPRWGFYHELVHAYQNNRGEAERDGHGHAQCVTEYPHELANEEWQTVGLGPYAARSVSENTIRAQMGVALRETYSGMRYGGSDHWGQQRDAEEPPRRAPRR